MGGERAVSRFAESLAAGRFVVTAEMPTIDGGGRDEVRHQLEPMRAYLDAANATDNTAAHAHASPLAVAIALREEGVEPIMQLVCRDRNRLALEADIVGASMHGIENVCCLTGDDVTAGDEPQARRVFDLDAPTLIATARGIAEGRYLSGRPVDPAPPLFIGCVENPGAPPYEYRVARAHKKAAAGARFLQLQISFEPERLDAFMAEAVRTGLAERVAILPSITILRSSSALRFMDAHVPGISVPAAVIERVESAPDQLEACLDLAHEQAAHAMSLPGVAGLHFISFRKDAGIAKTCRRLGIPTYAERVEHGYGSPVAV
jgi:methylenetetrahydrofolate reductase (NADPH)